MKKRINVVEETEEESNDLHDGSEVAEYDDLFDGLESTSDR